MFVIRHRKSGLYYSYRKEVRGYLTSNIEMATRYSTESSCKRAITYHFPARYSSLNPDIVFVSEADNKILKMEINKAIIMHAGPVELYRVVHDKFNPGDFDTVEYDPGTIIDRYLYMARDRDGLLNIFRGMPTKDEGTGVFSVKNGEPLYGNVIFMDADAFPEVTFENSPVKLKFFL